ncbi:enoyl-CoA hydratase/isomerase family protein [Aquabacterium sp. CECT 9606]|uniref:enoyl-CoA hydratase/isomerase family protein n=1 Tax=Aquabacterium sp. CECT 9606 TaxID=2845822 RepID=UPI001E652FC8|nr:enoyl-CoA hydratase/isomerase family protein [Aquabacterium sp. CECT 9606]CAH0352855.1 1,4-dihydroxy-2-naphthoyl-CoA synthase [Aquabacterium sp. CECT 9606]
MSEVQLQIVNKVALITLNRPQALNALSHGMVLQLYAMLQEVQAAPAIRAVVLRGSGAKAFCAGGDVIAIAQSVKDGSALHRDFFIDEYRLDLCIHTFSKPVVAFMHGIVMGGGMGLAQGASLRLVASNVRIAMPETRIGLIPDVGASYFFSKLPEPLARYLALTATTIGAQDAIYAQLADARSKVDDPEALPALLEAIDWSSGINVSDADQLRAALSMDDPATKIESAMLAKQWPTIFEHFQPWASLTELVHRLTTDGSPWALATLESLRSHSPLMLALTCESLKRGRHLPLKDCFKMEFGFIQQALSCGEFTEGVRALLVDKDRKPNWTVPRIEDLTPSVIEHAIRLADERSRSVTL